MKHLILSTVLVFATQVGFAKSDLSEACQETIETFVIAYASNVSDSALTVDDLTVDAYLNPKKTTLYASAFGKKDGAYFSFQASVTEDDIQNCSFKLAFDSQRSCRYSNYGDLDIDEMEGFQFGKTQIIENDKSLSTVQIDQIKKTIVSGAENSTVNDLIAETDDGSITYEVMTLPTGELLDYYSVYSGGNPFGSFFYQGTTDLAGDNSDGSICIYFKAK